MVYYVFQVIPVPLNDLGRDGFRSFRGRCEFQEGTNGWDSQKSSQSSSRTGIYHIYIISFIYNICLYIIYVYIYIYIHFFPCTYLFFHILLHPVSVFFKIQVGDDQGIFRGIRRSTFWIRWSRVWKTANFHSCPFQKEIPFGFQRSKSFVILFYCTIVMFM